MSKKENRHEIFLDWIQEQGQDKDNFAKFLWHINAHHSLSFLINICKNIVTAIKTWEKEIELGEYENDINNIKYCADFISQNENTLLNDLHEILALQNEEEIFISHPLRGTCLTINSCYASWLNISIDDDSNDYYQLLQLHALIASTIIMSSYSSIEDYVNNNQFISGARSVIENNSRVDVAWRYIRDLSEEEGLVNLLNEDGVELEQPTIDLYLDLTEIKKNLDREEYPPIVDKLLPLFKLAFSGVNLEERKGNTSNRQYIPRQMHNGHIRFSNQIIQELITETDEGQINEPKISVIVPINIDEKKYKLWSDLDLDPDENTEEDEIYLSDFGCEQETKSTVASYHAAKGAVKHASMHNQLLPNTKSMLTDFELGLLINECMDILDNSHDKIRKETALLILIMLWTGSDIVKARNIGWFNEDIANHRRISYLAHKKCWRLKAYTIRYKKKFNNESINFVKPLEKYILLPDIFNISKYFKEVFNEEIKKINLYQSLKNKDDDLEKDNNIQRVSSRLFPIRKNQIYKNSINSILRDLDQDHSITIKKIENYLFHLFAIEGSDDIADAMFITGKYHASGKTLLHYTTPYIKDIADKYTRITSNKITAILGEIDKSNLDLNSNINLNTQVSIGNNLCPTSDAAKNMVSNLQDELKFRLTSYLKSSLITYHNLYSFYTVQIIAYATGIRAIKDPGISSQDIDDLSGYAVISDKDGSDFYNSRLVWIPDVVRQQIQLYEEHVDLIFDYILHNRTTKSARQPNIHNFPNVFFLNDNFDLEHIRPKTCNKFLNDYLPLPLNVNRRFLRTTLKERNCPGEVINAFMGHWAMGQEPWGQYSSLPIEDLFRILKPHINEIIDILGWQPIKSQLIELS